MLILAAYGEPAEVWFETARALNAQGYVVWVLEPLGQSGSGHYGVPRDVIDASSLRPDVDAAMALAARMVRRRPLFLMAGRTSAPTAVAALVAGLAADGAILSAPTLSGPDATTARRMRQFGLGGLRAEGEAGWRRDGPDDRALGLTHDALRGHVRTAWQGANPDLRMGGPSWSWRAAFADQLDAVAAAPLGRVQTPVLVLQPTGGAAAAFALCRRLPHCRMEPLGPARPELELEVDEVRGAWLSAVKAFIEPRIARFPAPPPPARVGAED